MEESGSSHKQVSHEDVDYAAYIIYHRKGHKASEDLLGLCSQYTSEFILRDVDALQKNAVPYWLDGAPLAVRKEDWVIFKGTAAFREIKEWAAGQVQSFPAAAALSQGGVHSAKIDITSRDLPLAAEDDRYSDKPTKRSARGMEDGATLEAMMRMRSRASASRQQQA
jgi:hypothetical protein